MSQAVAEIPRKTRRWGDPSLLQWLKNPSAETYEIQVTCPEITFLGKVEQPDFACAQITMFPAERVIELKSLKRYLFSFRNTLMSYERFINVLYKDLMEVYQPSRLIVQAELRARGGISSKLRIDSVWRA